MLDAHTQQPGAGGLPQLAAIGGSEESQTDDPGQQRPVASVIRRHSQRRDILAPVGEATTRPAPRTPSVVTHVEGAAEPAQNPALPHKVLGVPDAEQGLVLEPGRRDKQRAYRCRGRVRHAERLRSGGLDGAGRPRPQSSVDEKIELIRLGIEAHQLTIDRQGGDHDERYSPGIEDVKPPGRLPVQQLARGIYLKAGRAIAPTRRLKPWSPIPPRPAEAISHPIPA